MFIGRRILSLALLFVIGAEAVLAQSASQLKDLRPGASGSFPSPVVVMGGAGYFAASDGVNGRELWRTDGTSAGTYQVVDIQPGSASSSPTNLVAAGDVLFFLASDGGVYPRLYGTNGLPGGTWAASLGMQIESLTVVGSTLFFRSCEFATGCELWKVPGTYLGLSSLVADIAPGSASSSPQGLAAFEDRLFFSAASSVGERELWVSDGSAEGTTLFKDIEPGLASDGVTPYSSAPGLGTVVGDRLYFWAWTLGHGTELFSTDGTPEGTGMVAEIRPGYESATTSPSVPMLGSGGKLFFFANDPAAGSVLFVSDGTAQGTTAFPQASGTAVNSTFADLGGLALIQLQGELWRSDGTSAGTQLVKQINLSGGSGVANLSVSGASAFFRAEDGEHGTELWRTDGTAEGTVLVADIRPSAGSNPGAAVLVGERLVFAADDGTTGVELWWIVPNRAPVAVAGADIEVGGGESAHLDGTSSSDPDEDSLTYVWRDAADVVVGTEPTLSLTLPDGLHDITLTVSDGQASATDTVRVAVGDTRPMVVTVVSFEEGFGSVDLDQPPGVCDGVAGGSASCTSDATFESIVTLTATPSPLSVFTGWSGACSGTLPACSVTMSSAKSVTATFRGPQTLTIEAVSFENGQGDVFASSAQGMSLSCPGVAGTTSTCTIPVRVGDEVQFSGIPGPLSILDSISGCVADPLDPNGAGCFPPFTMTGPTTVSATFRGPQMLTIEAVSFENGQGDVFASSAQGMSLSCPGVAGTTSTCTIPVRVGDEVQFSGIPGPLSILDSISGCVADPLDPNGAGCFPPFTMTGPKTVSATFRGPQTLTIEAVSFENGQGDVFASSAQGMSLSCPGVAGTTSSCTIPVRVGDEVQFSGIPGPLSILASISGCVADPLDPNGAGCFPPFTMTGPKTVSATFRGPQTLTIEAVSFENGQGDVFASSAQGMSLSCPGLAGTTSTCTIPVRVGDEVQFSGIPGPLSIVDSISGCVADPLDPNGAGCFPPFTMTGPKTVSARFRGPQPLAVSFGGDGTGEVAVAVAGACSNAQVNCTFPIRIGTFLELVANPSPDSLFESWSGACAGQGAVCSLTITDDVSTQAVFVLRNHPPVANAAGPYSGVRNQPISFSGAASTDPEPDTLTYAWDFGDGSPAGSGVAPTHAYATMGTFTVTLIVNDGTTNSTAATSTVTISNQAPVANAGGPYSGVRDQAVAFSGAASTDPDDDALTYSWDFGDGSPAGSGVAPTHAYASTGTFTVTLTVNDGTTNSTAATSTVTISNQAPAANAGGPYSGVRNQAIAFSGAGSTDLDGDALTYSWDFGDGTPAGSGVAPTHVYESTGTFTVTLTVNDGTTNSTAATSTVTISNQTPAASAGGPYSGVRNQAIAFSGAGSTDPDGDALTYSWDFGDGSPAGSGVDPTHAYASTGTFTVTLTVNDGSTNSTAATSTVTISNQTPAANAGGPYSGVRNQTIAFSGVASADPDGDALTYSWDFGDGSPAGSGVTPTHAYAATGTFTVTLTVNHGTTNSTAATSTVTISNQAPVAHAGGPYTGTRLAPVAFSGAASTDPDADALTYSWNFGDGGTATGPTPSHLYSATGTFTVTLTVNDGTTSSAPATSTVQITNVAPTVAITSPGPGTVFHAPAAVVITAAATDPDGVVAKVEFFAGGTKVGEALNAPYAIVWPAAVPGPYSLTAVVTDSSSATATSTPIVVIVNAPPTVSLTGPSDNAQFAAPASITVTAAAADVDGSITQVEFFRGTTSLGVDASSPFSVTWAGAPVGSYQLSAVATDNRGATVASSAITVKVTATLTPMADSYVHASKSNTNYGNATTLTVQQGSSNSSLRWTYLKVDLSTIPTITEARVRLFGRVSATTGTAINTAVYSVSNTSWTETGIKWSNKPATGTSALSTVPIVNNSTTARWYEFDVTAYLQAEKAAGRNVVTLAFKNLANSSPYVTFTSKQGAAANRPQVVVVP
jgi:ELWxxDGT repeat protein